MMARAFHVVGLSPQSDVEDCLLIFLAGLQRPIEPVSVYGPFADLFGLTRLQRNADMEHTAENAWQNRVRQARRRLVDLGYLNNARRGFWQVTPNGRERATYLEKLRTTKLEDLL